MKKLLPLAAMCILAAAVPCSAGTAAATLFGIDVNRPATPWPPATLSGPLPIGTLRLWDSAVDWARIETSRGVYDWAKLDDWVARAEAQGVEVLYTFGRTPNWATTQPIPAPTCAGAVNGLTYSCLPPADLDHGGNGPNAYWQEFVAALALRYRGRIKFYELWNELDVPAFWRGTSAQAVRMAKDAYWIIKTIDPSARVLTPSFTAGGAGALDTFLSAGGVNYVDTIAFHCRSAGTANTKPESVLSVITSFRHVMWTRRIASKPLWCTEGGWRAGELMEADVQAGYVARQYTLMAYAGVERYYWYQWDNPGGWGSMWSSTSGPQPSATAYAEIRKWLVGASLSCGVNSNGTTWRCQLSRPNYYSAQIVWDTVGGISYYVGTRYTQYRDLEGNVSPLRPGSTVTLGIKPVLLESFSVF